MATTILSGRSLTLTIATDDYSEQILDSAINFDTERLTFDTLAGKAYKYIDSNVTLDINFLNDAGKTPDSLYNALFTATDTAPDTALAFVLTLTTGVTLTGNVLPQYPGISASGADAQTCSVSLQVVGIPTEDLTA
jgi:Flp pilus assembly protein TadG